MHVQVEDTYRKIYISKGLTVIIQIKSTCGHQLEIEQLAETEVVKLDANRSNMSDNYSGNTNCTNGKLKDIFAEYAMMMEVF